MSVLPAAASAVRRAHSAMEEGAEGGADHCKPRAYNFRPQRRLRCNKEQSTAGRTMLIRAAHPGRVRPAAEQRRSGAAALHIPQNRQPFAFAGCSARPAAPARAAAQTAAQAHGGGRGRAMRPCGAWQLLYCSFCRLCRFALCCAAKPLRRVLRGISADTLALRCLKPWHGRVYHEAGFRGLSPPQSRTGVRFRCHLGVFFFIHLLLLQSP